MNTIHVRTIGVVMAVLTLLGFGAAAQTMIYDVNDLQAMQSNPAGNYMLANDIDASETSTWNGGAGFVPVGPAFTGTFDGAGHTISGLYINRPSTDYTGLFGGSLGAAIRNVRLVGVNITGARYTGSLTGGASNSSVTSSSATGSVTGTRETGGLVGQAQDSFMTACCSAITVSASGWAVGGLVGYLSEGTSLSDCCCSGGVSGSSDVGGLVGTAMSMMAPTSVTNCYSVGAVTGFSDIGGLVGRIYEDLPPAAVRLTSTYWDTQTSGQATSAGQAARASEGKTTAQMMQQATFLGWPFGFIWCIRENQTYPYLLAFPIEDIAVAVEQTVGQADPADTFPIRFDVLFNEPVVGFGPDDLIVSGTASGVKVALEGSGALYTILVFEAATDGTIEVSIPAGTCRSASGCEANEASSSLDNSVTYTIPEQVPIAWAPVALALLAAGVAAMRRRK